MEKLVVGDVVVVPFPFTDLEHAKRRPALVLAVFGRRGLYFLPDHEPCMARLGFFVFDGLYGGIVTARLVCSTRKAVYREPNGGPFACGTRD